MANNWEETDGTDWREEYKVLKGTVSIAEIRLLDRGAQTMKEAWQLGKLHAEYKKLKKNKTPKLPNLNAQS